MDTRTARPSAERWADALLLPDLVVVVHEAHLQPGVAHQAGGLLGPGARRGAAEAGQQRAVAPAEAQVHAAGLQRRLGQGQRGLGQHRGVLRPARRGGLGLGLGVQAQRQLEDQAERAQRPGEQLGQVVAGHVLDHLATRPRRLAVREGHLDSQDQVARPAVTRAQRARVAGGDHAADGGRALGVGRVEQQLLLGLGEHRLGLGQRQPGLDDRGQVALVVLEQAVVARGRDVLDLLVHRDAPVQLAPRAHEADRRAGFPG